MKKFSIFLLLAAFFVPLAMNAQNSMLKKSKGSVQTKGSVQLEMRASTNETPSNPLLSKLESAKEAALEELNNRAGNRGSSTVTASRITSTSATWTGSEGESWNVAITISNTNGLNQAVTNGYAQYGTQTNYATIGTFSTSGISGTITSIDVDCASYNGNGTVSVTVGGAAFGSSQSIPRWSNNAGGTRTFTGSASGNIVVTMTNGSYTHRAMYIKSITVTYQDAGCSAPEDFAASNVTSNSATFSWTETGTSDMWVIYYMAEDDEDVSYELADTNPFTLTGLNPVTTYYALVTPYCGDLDQDSEVITFTTADLPCSMPTDLAVNNITTNSATFSWSGEGESYNVQYRTPGGREIILYEDFEGDMDGWTETSVGSNTGIYSGAPNSGEYMYGFMRNGNNIQYLISPELSNIEEGSVFAFYHMAYNGNATIYVGYSSTTTATNQFTWGTAQTVTSSTSYDMYAMEIPAGTKYVGIRVNALSNGVYYFVDDAFVAGPYVEPGEWHTANNVTSPYTFTGMDPETEYEWQVQAVCGGDDGESLWASASSTFTTLSPCGTPTGLTTTDITNNSATLSWTAILDAYNVRYRKGFVYDFESATPWAVDNFAPCTTYDGDQYETYGFSSWTFPNAGYTGACIAFNNDNEGSSNMYSHSGNAFGVMFNAGSSSVQSNDWFILPELTIESGDVFSFWGREITDQYGAETINVGIYGSTDGTFSAYLAQNVSVSSTEWTEFSYDLSSYAGQTIKLAINCVSQDIFGFMFDDIFVGNPSNDWSTPVAVNGSSYALTGLDMDTYYTWQVQGTDCDGNGGTTSWASDYFTTLNGILVTEITADDVEVVVGGTANITGLEVLPTDATNPAVTYTSNDETIATVTDAGVVTGVAVGTTTITIAATDGSGVTFDINVTVNGIDVTGITAGDDITIMTGETATISYTVTPNNATDASVTFTSEDATIATVDADGVVTGVSVGETTITIASVSNPDVTATVTVTVTSNPDAVQFTVNVPATAHPGDVITVEAYMAAPTSGNYDGFTSLGVHLYYDNTAFQHTADPSYGAVGNACMMHTFTYPEDGVVRVSFIQPAGSPTTVTGLLFSMEFTVLEGIESGSYTFHVEPMAAANFTCNYNNGQPATQIPYEYTPSTVEVTVLSSFFKDIIGYAGPDGNGGNYYLIATPIGTVAPADVKDANDATRSMVDSNDDYDFDLYYFDNDQDFEWINYKGDANFSNPGGFNLEPGKGYLYANSQNIRLEFTGYAYTELDEVTLTISSTNPYSMKNWNLVGNPFAQTAWLVEGYDFYTMNNDATMIVQVGDGFENSIEAMEGIFVKAANDGDVLHFTTTEPAKSNGKGLILNLNQGQKLIDRAVVRFGEGRTLPKFQIKKNCTQLYIPMDNEDYAVVRSEEVGEMPVSFKAEENGSYTLNFSALNTEFGYLHLIDNMNGNDVDLLATPSYSFVAKTTDYAQRFKLVFATGNVLEDSFAFFSNGSFVINNEGNATLQVIDINGRILSNETINGCANVNVNAASGVYMLRLINGDNVKVQKVVVR